MNTRSIGFSTGTCFRFMDSDFPENSILSFPTIQGYLPTAEINLHRPDYLPRFLNFGRRVQNNEEFRHWIRNSAGLSVQTPSFEISYGDNRVSDDVLAMIRQVAKLVHIERFVLHPDLIDKDAWDKLKGLHLDLGILSHSGICLENSDSHKEFGQTVADMKKVLDRIGCGIVLNLAHCFTIDPTMRLAHAFIDVLGPKIVEVHLSGVGECSRSHLPLFQTMQDIILDPLRRISSDIPIIIESICDYAEDLEKELEYIAERIPS